MPIRVRCPSCSKVLNAPEAAAGKAVKCPDCETKVKVPALDADDQGSDSSSKGEKRRAKKAKDDDDFLANIDLERAIDTESGLCPKCGTLLDEDDQECPKCGVDRTTGQLSARAKKRKNLKGPDPAEFYKYVWSDSWAFTKENFTVGLRTGLYWILTWIVAGGCVAAANAIVQIPPKIFFFVLAAFLILILPGWIWCLTVETVRISAARKRKVSDLNFDIFTNIALGIKTIFWTIAFCWLPFSWFLYPLAMIHMAMPVTIRGWVNFSMFSTCFKNFGPTIYYWVISFVTTLPFNIATSIVGIVFGGKIAEALRTNFKPAFPASEMWIAIGVTATVLVFAVFFQSFVIVFQARVIGLIAYYFQNTLDLVTFVPEKVYKKKEVKTDKWGNVIKSTEQKVLEAVLAFVVLCIIVGVGYFAYTYFKPKQ